MVISRDYLFCLTLQTQYKYKIQRRQHQSASSLDHDISITIILIGTQFTLEFLHQTVLISWYVECGTAFSCSVRDCTAICWTCEVSAEHSEKQANMFGKNMGWQLIFLFFFYFTFKVVYHKHTCQDEIPNFQSTADRSLCSPPLHCLHILVMLFFSASYSPCLHCVSTMLLNERCDTEPKTMCLYSM